MWARTSFQLPGAALRSAATEAFLAASPSKPATHPTLSLPQGWSPPTSPRDQSAGAGAGRGQQFVMSPALCCRPPCQAHLHTQRGSNSTWGHPHIGPQAREDTVGYPRGGSLGERLQQVFQETPEGGAAGSGVPQVWAGDCLGSGRGGEKDETEGSPGGTWSPVAPVEAATPRRGPYPVPLNLPCHGPTAQTRGCPSRAALCWAPPVPHRWLPAPTPPREHRSVLATPHNATPTQASLLLSSHRRPPYRARAEVTSLLLTSYPCPLVPGTGPRLTALATPDRPRGLSPLRGRGDQGSTPRSPLSTQSALPACQPHQVERLRASACFPFLLGPPPPQFSPGHRGSEHPSCRTSPRPRRPSRLSALLPAWVEPGRPGSLPAEPRPSLPAGREPIPPASASFRELHLPAAPRLGGGGASRGEVPRRRGERGEPCAERYCGVAPPGGAPVSGTRPGGLAESGGCRGSPWPRRRASPCRRTVPGRRSRPHDTSAGTASVWPEDDLGRPRPAVPGRTAS